MEEIIGIDLGTTNSMAAWVSELGAEILLKIKLFLVAGVCGLYCKVHKFFI